MGDLFGPADELGGGEPEGAGDRDEHLHRRVTKPALDPREVGPVEPRRPGELLQIQSPFEPELTNRTSKLLAGRRSRTARR